MTEWTNSAKAELDRYCTRVRASLATSGADIEEVIDDLKRHIEAEIQSAQLRVVTEEDVRRILARVGEPVIQEEDTPPAQPMKTRRKVGRGSKILGLGAAFFGIVLPIVTLGFEM